MRTSELFYIFEKLPPRFVLDGYWNIFLAIRMDLFKQEEEKKHELLEKLLSLSGLSLDALKVILDDVLTLLVEENLMVQSQFESHVEVEFELEEIYNVLRKSVRNSTRRMVAWAIWRLWTRKSKITMEDILREVSYPDEVYEVILKNSLSSKYPIRQSKEFLLSDACERVKRIQMMYPEEKNPHEIIQRIRQIEAEEVSKVLERIGITDNFSENENIENVKQILYECSKDMWPFFGTIVVKPNPYFKLFRGQSSTLYVDFPNEAIEYVIERLGYISETSKTKEEFYERAKMFINAVNDILNKEGIPWLRFSVQTNL